MHTHLLLFVYKTFSFYEQISVLLTGLSFSLGKQLLVFMHMGHCIVIRAIGICKVTCSCTVISYVTL